MRARMTAVACAALLAAGCTLQDQNAPSLTGPSGYGLSLSLSAAPSILPRDGSSKSTITVTARDAAGNPASSVRLLASVSPAGAPLMQADAVTDGSGVARFVLTAPTTSVVANNNEIVVAIHPVGDNFDNLTSHSVALGLLGPSNATYPTSKFTVLPEAPKAGTPAVFNAMSTTDEGAVCGSCTFSWIIAGVPYTGAVVSHVFPMEGAYSVQLTATDSTGASSTLNGAVEIAPAEEKAAP
jgi:Invasin, domain 3/PKD domain